MPPIGPQWKRASACALIALSVGIASAASGGPTARPIAGATAASSDAYDDDLMFTNRGASIFLPDHLRRPDNSERLMVGTDNCGMLTSVRDIRKMIAPTGFGEDWGEFDEDDPSIQGQMLIDRWLSVHPEIAVIARGIDKWCGDDSVLDEDDPALPVAMQEDRLRGPTASPSPLTTSFIA